MTIDNTPENIKKLRKKIGLTQTECGEIFGVGLSTWQKKEAKTTLTIFIKTGKVLCACHSNKAVSTKLIKNFSSNKFGVVFHF